MFKTSTIKITNSAANTFENSILLTNLELAISPKRYTNSI